MLCTLKGIVAINTYAPGVLTPKIKKESTAPHGIIYLGILLSIMYLSLNHLLGTIFPQYSLYGTQTYCANLIGDQRNCTDVPEKIVYCSIDGPADICTPTTFSTLNNRIAYALPNFGNALFYLQFAFFASFFLNGALVIRSVVKKEEEVCCAY